MRHRHGISRAEEPDARRHVRRVELRVEEALHGRRYAVDLRDGADAHDACEHPKDGERHGERLPPAAKALLDVVERAAQHSSVWRHLAVLHREESFGILRRHAEERRDFHPEKRTGAACAYCRRDADDVAGANRRGERGAKRGKGAHLARHAIAFLGMEHVDEGAPQVEDMGEAQAQREDKPRDKNRADKRQSPHPFVHDIDKFRKRLKPSARRLNRSRDSQHKYHPCIHIVSWY